MSVETPEKDLTDDSLYADDLPEPEPPQDITAGQEAPYGWVTDRKTGERRPKKAPGRPRKPPGPEDLAAADMPPEPEPDLAPGPRRRTTKPAADVPMPRGGIIAKGVDKLYRRAGKIVRAMDHDIGTAIIECTRADEPEDITVGQAWEELAKTNPRIRAWLLRALKGGAWYDLAWAHAPIAIAIAMKPAVQRLLPVERLMSSVLAEDEDTQPEDLRPADGQQIAEMARAQAQKIAAKMGVQVPEHVVAAAARQAESVMAGQGQPITPPYEQHDLGDGAPPAFRRSQPRHRSRAARKG